MENGKWKMEDGRWKMENGQFWFCSPNSERKQGGRASDGLVIQIKKSGKS